MMGFREIERRNDGDWRNPYPRDFDRTHKMWRVDAADLPQVRESAWLWQTDKFPEPGWFRRSGIRDEFAGDSGVDYVRKTADSFWEPVHKLLKRFQREKWLRQKDVAYCYGIGASKLASLCKAGQIKVSDQNAFGVDVRVYSHESVARAASAIAAAELETGAKHEALVAEAVVLRRSGLSYAKISKLTGVGERKLSSLVWREERRAQAAVGGNV